MITSTSNKRVKELIELTNKAKARNAAGVFIAEGRKMFLEAPTERVRSVYVEEDFYQKILTQEMYDNIREKLELLSKQAGVSCEIVTQEVFAKISDTKTPQGILCVVAQKNYTFEQLLHVPDGKKPLLMILEDIQDPGNFGTMLRTAEGAGVNGFIVTRNTVDRYHPKTIRATMGSIYRMPCMETEDLTETIERLKQEGICVYAAHLKGTAYYDAYDYKKGTAFLIGNEGNGLKKETADAADVYIKIPMEGQVESLNAAIAGTLLMYEANRQRRQEEIG